MNSNTLQVGSTKFDRLILPAVIPALVLLASLRGYGAAGIVKVLLRFADTLVNALVTFGY